jgi:PAS domain S-box-containing protein
VIHDGLVTVPAEGQMAQRVSAFDWSRTPLGAMEGWPQSLRLAVDLCLNNRFPMHVWWGPQLINIYNDAFISILGNRHPDALGRPACDVWAEVWHRLQPQVEAVMQRGESTWNPRTAMVLERNGFPEEAWFTWSYSPIRDQGGGVGGLLCIATEDTLQVLTERNRDELQAMQQQHLVAETSSAQAALRDRNTLLQGISDSLGDIIFAKDRDGRMLFANPAALSLIGKPIEQVLGKTDAEFLEDKEAARAVMQNDQSVMQNGVAVQIEEVVPFPDGARRVWLSRKMPNKDSQGKVVGLLGISRDVTELSDASQRIKSLYTVAAALSEAVTPQDVAHVTVHQGLLAVGATAGSLVLLTQDPQWLEMVESVGYPSEVIKRWERFSLDSPIPLAEAVRKGETVYVESPEDRLARYPALAALNAIASTRASACVPLSIGGRIVGALALSFDRPAALSPDNKVFILSMARQCAQAMERARLFEAEQRLRNEAERASRMKDEFLATLSHELRTPLNAILGWSQIMKNCAVEHDDIAQGVEVIERNARSQSQIIEDLLDMSRIISGRCRLDVQPLDLAEIARAAIDTARPTADVKGVGLQLVVDSLNGALISGDANRIQQVLWNLLTNAIKFTPRGGSVQLSLQCVGSHLQLSVIDTGQGIEPDFLPFVFDRFRQADASTTRRHGGLGLGLSIVKQLVELHGGSVAAHSDGAGRGSTFIVALPLSAVYPQADANSERHHPRPVPSPSGAAHSSIELAGVRVLVVDDELDARTLVKKLLEDCHAIVTATDSVERAVSLVEGRQLDVLVSDIGMPREDGYALINRVRSLGKDRGGDIPAIALTAYARPEDRMKAIAAGFHMHAAKPVEPCELLRMVADAAGKTPKSV